MSINGINNIMSKITILIQEFSLTFAVERPLSLATISVTGRSKYIKDVIRHQLSGPLLLAFPFFLLDLNLIFTFSSDMNTPNERVFK